MLGPELQGGKTQSQQPIEHNFEDRIYCGGAEPIWESSFSEQVSCTGDRSEYISSGENRWRYTFSQSFFLRAATLNPHVLSLLGGLTIWRCQLGMFQTLTLRVVKLGIVRGILHPLSVPLRI